MHWKTLLPVKLGSYHRYNLISDSNTYNLLQVISVNLELDGKNRQVLFADGVTPLTSHGSNGAAQVEDTAQEQDDRTCNLPEFIHPGCR